MRYSNKIIKMVLSLSVISIPITFTSCGFLNDLFGQNNNQVIGQRIQNNNFEFISQRTFSLKFWDPNANSEVYGTGWIFGKNNISNNYYEDDYYIATNLHVASTIQNRGKTLYEYNSSSKKYELKYNENFSYLDIGYIVSKNNNGSYKLGTNYSLENTNSTQYLTTLNINTSVSIAYTSIDLFSSMNLYNKNNVYNVSTYQNATSDIAILKINFSNPIKNKTYLGLNALKESLDAYNANPTKFGTYSANDNIIIGGFPFKENSNGRGGTWTASYHPSPYKEGNPSNLFSGILSDSNSNWMYALPTSDMNKIKKEYVLNGYIPFKTNEYGSYFNVSLQALFANVNLSGGSSGSLAMNDKQEVIGIYWGGYSMSNGQEIGTIDIFNNVMDRFETYKDYNTNQTYTNTLVKTYNIVEDAKSKLNL